MQGHRPQAAQEIFFFLREIARYEILSKCTYHESKLLKGTLYIPRRQIIKGYVCVEKIVQSFYKIFSVESKDPDEIGNLKRCDSLITVRSHIFSAQTNSCITRGPKRNKV